MGLLEMCEKYFGTTNLYEVFGITEKASDKEVKKAYHKLSLRVHPDRVEDDKKLEATEKFKVLGGVHAILSDKEKRSIYDETKCVDDDDNIVQERDWTAYWRVLFKKITLDDIKKYEQEYTGSQEERQDLKNAYLASKGDMDYITDHVQFARTDQEPRLREILNEMIESGEIPSYKKFTHEPEKKKQRRKAKENHEAVEAEEYKKELGLGDGQNSLELMIRQKQSDRAQQLDSFIDVLAAKYGGGEKAGKRKAAKTAPAETKSKKKKKN